MTSCLTAKESLTREIRGPLTTKLSLEEESGQGAGRELSPQPACSPLPSTARHPSQAAGVRAWLTGLLTPLALA